MSKDDVNPETIARYEAGFNKVAKNGKLDVLEILDALDVAKESNYNEDDIVDALEVMGIKNQPLSKEQFMDLIGILKDPETIIDAFTVFDPEKKGLISEEEVRNMLHKYAPDLKGKEVEDIIERPNVSSNAKINYKAFVEYWAEQ